MSRRTAILGLALAASLSACGKVGPLERPGPMFGKASAAGAPAGQDPSRPVSTVDPRDRATDAPERPATPQ